MDTNNNGQITSADETGKDAGNPGKVIIADTLDVNGNNIPGYADGISTISAGATDSLPEGTFAPLQLTVQGISNLSNADIEFLYSAADPTAVTQTATGANGLNTYSPGPGGYIRLWSVDSTTPRNANGILSGGNFITANTAMPLSDIVSSLTSATDLYVEGVNPSNNGGVTIKVEIDPTGQNNFTAPTTITDEVKLTVAGLQLVYTDVTGISHASPTTQFTTNMDNSRINPLQQPSGIAADWQKGVDDGSLLLVRAVGSPVLESLIQQGNLTLDFGQLFPGIGTGVYSLQSDNSNGALLPLNTDNGLWQTSLAADKELKGVQINTNPAQGPTQWEGAAAGGATLDVLGVQFYQPPAEFIPAGQTNTNYYRQISLGVSLNYSNTTLPPLYAGAKPGSLLLTRPPVVFVAGINSISATAWNSMAAYLQKQGYIISSASYAHHYASDNGMGPLTTDWQSVQNATDATLRDFRDGEATSTTIGYDPLSGAGAPLIAVQKVDVVAHSYGGLLTRWYMEQAANSSGVAGSEFKDYRDIRTLIELGTPNLGSPLANMVDAIYSDPTIGKAQLDSWLVDLAAFLNHVTGVPNTATTMLGFLNYLQSISSQGLPTLSANGTIYPFYEDDAVNSPLLDQLNVGDPFNYSVSYAAVYGTSPKLPVKYGLFLNAYADMQPMGPNGQSYFPWINSLDGAANDSVVPNWSAALPDLGYNKPVNAPHTKLESDPQTEADVLAFLANPNLPSGSAQATAAGSTGWNAPVSDQNAYSGGTNSGPSTEVSGAGLNPEAIVGAQLDGNNDYGPATWNLDVTSGPEAGAGIKNPVLTGMATKSELTNGLTISLEASNGVPTSYSSPSPWLGIPASGLSWDQLDSSTAVYGESGVFVDANAWAAAGLNDYVPFEITVPEMGRGITQGVTGPSLNGVQDDSALGSAIVDYTIGNLTSASTLVNLPAYTPPAPVVVSDDPTGSIQLQLNGVFKVTDATSGSSPTSYNVKLYDSGTLLYEQDVSAASEPVGVWNGLAISYSLAASLNHDANGDITNTVNNVLVTVPSPANILQNFWESNVTGDGGYNSGTVEIS